MRHLGEMAATIASQAASARSTEAREAVESNRHRESIANLSLMKRGFLSLALCAAAALFGGFGSASASEQLPWCNKATSITDPEIHAPKKVAAGRHFTGRYALNTESARQISKIRFRLIPSRGKQVVWKSRYTSNTWEFWLDLKDGRTRFRVDWVETTDGGGAESIRCRNSIGTSITPWNGRGAKFRVGYPAGGEVVWRLRNGPQLCGGKRRLQATTDNYQLRVKGANGNLRSTVGDICEGSEKTRGKKSGKWELYYWDSSRHWSFSAIASNMPPGNYPFKWQLFRGKKMILYGRFGLRAEIG